MFRGATAVVGIGQTPYYKRGASPDPEMKLALRAIVAACEDAGISPRDIDGFVSYGSESNDGQRLMRGLGTRELRFTSLVWAHGGGIPGALGLAAGAIISGQAEIVVVYRAMAQGDHGRLRVVVSQDSTSAQYLVNGLEAPIQLGALKARRLLNSDQVPVSTFQAVAQADYYHAKNNPAAVGRDILLEDQVYQGSRMIAEPFRLFDCSRENDSSAAVILMSAQRARHVTDRPVYLLSAPMGAMEGWGLDECHTPFTSAGFAGVAKRLWAESGYGPDDVDVAQIYDNFSGHAVAAIIDHGFCSAEGAGDFITFENLIAPSGKLPINTSGGGLAEGFIHGMGLVPEAIRQVRGQSCNPVRNVNLSLMTGGPGDSVVSSALFGSEETL